ncbi:MAG: alpha/beta hydrolase, partial [Chloroflexota bacterium]
EFQSDSERRNLPMSHYILIHGAWHNGSAFNALKTVLEDRGHTVTAPTLPGHKPNDPDRISITFHDYLNAVKKVVETSASPANKAILVGHSSAGFLLQSIAADVEDFLEELVFINAWLLPNGTSQADAIQAADPQAWTNFKNAATQASDNCIPVIESFVRGMLMGGDTAAQQDDLLNILVPQPLALMEHPIDCDGFAELEVPKTLIHCKVDTSLPQGAYIGMANQNLGSYDLIHIDTGHEGIFTHPAMVAGALEKAAVL